MEDKIASDLKVSFPPKNYVYTCIHEIMNFIPKRKIHDCFSSCHAFSNYIGINLKQNKI